MRACEKLEEEMTRMTTTRMTRRGMMTTNKGMTKEATRGEMA